VVSEVNEKRQSLCTVKPGGGICCRDYPHRREVEVSHPSCRRLTVLAIGGELLNGGKKIRPKRKKKKKKQMTKDREAIRSLHHISHTSDDPCLHISFTLPTPPALILKISAGVAECLSVKRGVNSPGSNWAAAGARVIIGRRGKEAGWSGRQSEDSLLEFFASKGGRNRTLEVSRFGAFVRRCDIASERWGGMESMPYCMAECRAEMPVEGSMALVQ